MNRYFPDHPGREQAPSLPFVHPPVHEHGISPTPAVLGSLPTLLPTPSFSLPSTTGKGVSFYVPK